MTSTLPSLSQQFVATRDQFPALARTVQGQNVAYFDGPGGTQVPNCVIDAISDYLSNRNANHEGLFLTSRESDQMLHETHRAVADLLGASDPECVCFGSNMTTLTFALSRSLAKTWQPGDEVVVTKLDHDANVTPWVLAAEDAGVQVRYVNIHQDDCTLDLDEFQRLIGPRTRLVAMGCASNATGTVNPIDQVVRWAHDVGALVFLDAVHYAPHALIDVEKWGCDFLACSAYKFFGPHVGILWGRRELLEQLPAYKLRPVPDRVPDRWMTGTQNHEGLAGTLAAVNYLEGIGKERGSESSRRESLRAAYEAIGIYEQNLVARLLSGLSADPAVTIWGIQAADRLAERLPTVSITHRRWTASELAAKLGEQGIFVWNGNYYALQLTESLGLEPEGMVRIGLVHYNTVDEIDRLLNSLAELR